MTRDSVAASNSQRIHVFRCDVIKVMTRGLASPSRNGCSRRRTHQQRNENMLRLDGDTLPEGEMSGDLLCGWFWLRVGPSSAGVHLIADYDVDV